MRGQIRGSVEEISQFLFSCVKIITFQALVNVMVLNVEYCHHNRRPLKCSLLKSFLVSSQNGSEQEVQEREERSIAKKEHQAEQGGDGLAH